MIPRRDGLRVAALTAACLGLLPSLAEAQIQVSGMVVAAASDNPLAGARVTALVARHSVVTDRFGRFTIWLTRLPDTLQIAFIGSRQTVLAVEQAPTAPLRVALELAPVQLSDVVVTAPPAVRDLDVSSLGRWQLSMDEARAVPPAIETDVFRALTLVPAVSFSTPLSARPIIRGYDAAESSFRIDGHEVVNLYHIGRIFSAFPADAAQQVTVVAAPARVTDGGTTAGIVDVAGRGGPAQGTDGGADLSLISASGWLGGTAGARWFGAARVVHLSALEAVSSHAIPYNFQDAYASGVVTDHGHPIGRVTAFASRDHLLDRSLGSGMDWSNVLLGTRWDLLRNGPTALAVSTSATQFSQDVANISARGSRLDIRNRFGRVAGSAEFAVSLPRTRLSAGVSTGWRRIANRVTPLLGNDFQPTDLDVGRFEFGGFGEWAQTLGPASLQMGVRLDAARGARIWQPRARVQLPVGQTLSIAAGVGRTGRLHHLVSDPHSEPDIAFYDFWLWAGLNGVPVPVVDHATVDLDAQRGDVTFRVSAYASRGRGLVELRPVAEPAASGVSQYRYGRGRTWGAEVQVGLRGSVERPSSLSLTYVLGHSERDWGGGWVPWALDHRHLVRLAGQAQLGRRWTVFGGVEAGTGVPMTPIEQVILALRRPTASDSFLGSPTYVFGPENSARSGGTVRVDAGARYRFSGPWRSRMSLGLSVINLGFGPVAPLVPASPEFVSGPPGEPDLVRVRYERLFALPAVPTATLRIEF